MYEIFYKKWNACQTKSIQSSGGIPQDVELCDASLIIPKKDIFKHMGSYAAFADLFRWKLTYDTGGYYVDTDVVCLQQFDFKENLVVGWKNKNILITPTVLGFEQGGHPLAERMLYNAVHPLAIRPYDSFQIKKRKIIKRFSQKKIRAIGWGESADPVGLSNEYFLEKDNYGVSPYLERYFIKFLMRRGSNL